MNLNLNGVIREVRTRAHNNRLNCVFEKDLKVPYATVDALHVALPDPTWDDVAWDKWWYALEHELGHVVPEMLDSYDVMAEEGFAPQSFIGTCMNICEDHRQEHFKYDEYEGRKKRLNKGRKIFTEEYYTPGSFGHNPEPHRLAAEALSMWDTKLRENWMSSLSGYADTVIPTMTEQQQQWIRELEAGDYGDRLLDQELTSKEEYKLVEDIIRDIFKFDLDKEKEQAKQQRGKGNGNDKDTSGKKESSHGENREAKETSEEGEQEQEEQAKEVNYSDLLAHVHSGERLCPDGYHESLIKINYDTNTSRFNVSDPSKYTLYDYTNGSITPKVYDLRIMQDQTQSGLSKHVKRLLQVRSVAHYQHGLKRGKISPKSIYRGGLQGTASEQKVFRKKIDSNILDTAVTVLCDMSGSMSGEKVLHASVAAKLLNEAISVAGVPLEIIGFDWDDDPRHSIWKTFTKKVDSEELKLRMSHSVGKQMCENSDGESLLFAYERLIKQKQKRKLLIVLSDGSPSAGYTDADWYTKEIIQRIEKQGIVELYGIGIRDRNVKRLYKQSEIIKKASELEAALLKVIEHKIIG